MCSTSRTARISSIRPAIGAAPTSCCSRRSTAGGSPCRRRWESASDSEHARKTQNSLNAQSIYSLRIRRVLRPTWLLEREDEQGVAAADGHVLFPLDRERHRSRSDRSAGPET